VTAHLAVDPVDSQLGLGVDSSLHPRERRSSDRLVAAVRLDRLPPADDSADNGSKRRCRGLGGPGSPLAMASFHPQEFGFDVAPPRPTTPPVRRGFILVLLVLSFLASLVYGIPYVTERAGYAWEAGRSRAALETLEKLDKAGIVGRSSALFRLASAA